MDVNTTNTIVTVVGFISTIASLILAIVAIWLSIVFFRMSSTLSTTTTEAAKGIGASVERLEKLFDKLYADTFSMMKDTVSDMRHHIWPDKKIEGEDMSQVVEKKADEKVNVLRKEMDSELSRLLRGQEVTEANIDSLRHEMHGLIEKAIRGSRNAEIEAREETIRDKIMSVIGKRAGTTRVVTARELHELICKISGPCHPGDMIDELIKMERDGMIETFGGKEGEHIRADTLVALR